MKQAPLVAHAAAVPGRLLPTDIALEAGKLTLLVGPNGAGKTSLLHRLAGIGHGSGAVMLDGQAIETLGPGARIGRIALLPAARELVWPLKARDVVSLGAGPHGHQNRVEAVLASVDALQFADRPVDRLSTGERARVLLARALVAAPAVLLLDEPAAHLDPARQIALVERLRIEAGRGAAVLASIHDLALARTHADRVIVMEAGRVVADGPPADALAPAVLARVFGVAWDAESGWRRA